jgi:hypothetical protein
MLDGRRADQHEHRAGGELAGEESRSKRECPDASGAEDGQRGGEPERLAAAINAYGTR